MRIISWNVNGLRAAYKKGAWDWVISESPDIICIQEVKAELEALPPPLQSPLGYYSYFNFPKKKKGYSGVALYTKNKPTTVNFDLAGDEEGRIIEAHYRSGGKDFVLLNVYFPNGGGLPERLQYKLKFYEKFLDHVENIRKKGKSIIFCGDINVAHKEIDIARPKENQKHVGFLPVERAWMDKVLSKNYVDVFRHLNPNLAGAYTYWDMKSFARDRNVGWRIDYFVISKDILDKVINTQIYSHILGSDHCPIELEISV